MALPDNLHKNASPKGRPKIISWLCCNHMSREGVYSSGSTDGPDAMIPKKRENSANLPPDLDASNVCGGVRGTIREARVEKTDGGIHNEHAVVKHLPAEKHPAANYPPDMHWAERQKDIQEKFCDGLEKSPSGSVLADESTSTEGRQT